MISFLPQLLVMFFGVTPSVAVGTDLLYAGITKAGGSFVHGNQGGVRWKVAMLLAAGSVPSAVLTTLTF